MTPVAVRQSLVDALRLDLVGPQAGSEHRDETLAQSPSRWYLTGFLVPTEANEEQRRDETAGEGVDEMGAAGTGDDAVTPEPAAARRVYFPSSLGLSLLVSGKAKDLRAVVRWGDYRREVRNAGEGVRSRERPSPSRNWRCSRRARTRRRPRASRSACGSESTAKSR